MVIHIKKINTHPIETNPNCNAMPPDSPNIRLQIPVLIYSFIVLGLGIGGLYEHSQARRYVRGVYFRIALR